MHYNLEDTSADAADLHTYMLNPEVFDLKNGHIEGLTST